MTRGKQGFKVKESMGRDPLMHCKKHSHKEPFTQTTSYHQLILKSRVCYDAYHHLVHSHD